MKSVNSSQRSVGPASQGSQNNEVNTRKQTTQPLIGVMTSIMKKVTWNPFHKSSDSNSGLENLNKQAGNGIHTDLRMAKLLKKKPRQDKFSVDVLQRKQNYAHQLNTNNSRSTEVINKIHNNLSTIAEIAKEELKGDMLDNAVLYRVALEFFPDFHAAEFALDMSNFVEKNPLSMDMSVQSIASIGNEVIKLASKFCVSGAEKEVFFSDGENKNKEKKLLLDSQLEELTKKIQYTKTRDFYEHDEFGGYGPNLHLSSKEKIISDINAIKKDFLKPLFAESKYLVNNRIESIKKENKEKFTNILTKEIMKNMIDEYC